MKAFFKELFEYSHHLNQKFISVLIENENKSIERSVKFQNHIINAHQIWNSRLLDKKTATAVWQINVITDLKKLDAENYNTTIDIINILEFSQITTYTNTKGETFSNSLRDILFHVVNHSTHHRAQISSDLKQNGVEPLISDYIFYKREHK